MDSSTLNTILMIRCLLGHLMFTDRFEATNSLLSLQDALELTANICLKEKGIEMFKNNGNFLSFNEIINKCDMDIAKLIDKGALKALNLFRVGGKHYGRTIDVSESKKLANLTIQNIELLIFKTFEKKFSDIIATELIQNQEVKKYLNEAIKQLEEYDKNSFKSLLFLSEIRKALFIFFEEDFSIEEWENDDSLLTLLYKRAAPYYTRNKKWIAENVKEPFDYIQIDYQFLQNQLLQCGIFIPDFMNLLRLTPKVFRYKNTDKWVVENKFSCRKQSLENLKYCLYKTINMIYLKESYDGSHKYLSEKHTINFSIKTETHIYEKANLCSKKLAEINEEETFEISSFVPGLKDNDKYFAEVIKIPKKLPAIGEQGMVAEPYIKGYIPVNDFNL